MNSECSICFEIIRSTENEKPFATRCGHVFHENCINICADNHRKCPQCNQPILRSQLIRLFIDQSERSAESIKDETIEKLKLQLSELNEKAQLQYDLIAALNKQIATYETQNGQTKKVSGGPKLTTSTFAVGNTHSSRTAASSTNQNSSSQFLANNGSKSSELLMPFESIPVDTKHALYKEIGRIIFGESGPEITFNGNSNLATEELISKLTGIQPAITSAGFSFASKKSRSAVTLAPSCASKPVHSSASSAGFFGSQLSTKSNSSAFSSEVDNISQQPSPTSSATVVTSVESLRGFGSKSHATATTSSSGLFGSQPLTGANSLFSNISQQTSSERSTPFIFSSTNNLKENESLHGSSASRFFGNANSTPSPLMFGGTTATEKRALASSDEVTSASKDVKVSTPVDSFSNIFSGISSIPFKFKDTTPTSSTALFSIFGTPSVASSSCSSGTSKTQTSPFSSCFQIAFDCQPTASSGLWSHTNSNQSIFGNSTTTQKQSPPSCGLFNNSSASSAPTEIKSFSFGSSMPVGSSSNPVDTSISSSVGNQPETESSMAIDGDSNPVTTSLSEPELFRNQVVTELFGFK